MQLMEKFERLPILLASLFLLPVAIVFFAAASQAAPLPLVDKQTHMGVASCAGSTCHGAVEPWKGSNIKQNEFVIWQRQDKHAKAYQVLLNERSKRIARNLGLKSAQTAKICLDCHADNVPKSRRHRSFQLSDGVACEACHGGAGVWVGTHIAAKASHKVNIQNGLYPAADPVDRARLCLSCHFGDDTRFVTHRIMGAGHPRMSFELDTFTATQPAHYKVDADYRKRKGNWSGVKTWAIGQALAFQMILDILADPKRGVDGVFPELVVFDCYTCHHRMSNLKWQPRKSVGLGPGIPRINDANLLMLQIIATQVDTAVGNKLQQHMLALHAATRKNRSALLAEVKALRGVIDDVVARFSKHRFSKADMMALFNGVIAKGLSGDYFDYPGAEQATMALSAIVNSMRNTGAINAATFKSMNAALDKAFNAVEKDEAYVPATFVATLKALQATAPK